MLIITAVLKAQNKPDEAPTIIHFLDLSILFIFFF